MDKGTRDTDMTSFNWIILMEKFAGRVNWVNWQGPHYQRGGFRIRYHSVAWSSSVASTSQGRLAPPPLPPCPPGIPAPCPAPGPWFWASLLSCPNSPEILHRRILTPWGRGNTHTHTHTHTHTICLLHTPSRPSAIEFGRK